MDTRLADLKRKPRLLIELNQLGYEGDVQHLSAADGRYGWMGLPTAVRPSPRAYAKTKSALEKLAAVRLPLGSSTRMENAFPAEL
ncbi:hypothetical protein ACVMB3_005678 [Sinorhizobium meliloti]|nr:hypothetical protein CN205_32580 [Sinorhizobium meliloti]RVM02950.1 hypothetical protein CN142_25975 [Sinorhizobium meliloti]RVO25374.1 hypothetical protein CN095_30680 [Sinorhizobium meliloti]